MRVVLVTGGRNYNNAAMVDLVLRQYAPDLVIHGGARGADSLAGEWAFLNGVATEMHLPDWRLHGLSAGYRRNERMAEALDGYRQSGCETVVVAFPGGKGTRGMIRIAQKMGFTTEVVQ